MSDPWSELLAIAAVQHGVFSRRQSRALGIDHHRLRRRVHRGELEPICTGVLRIVGSARTWHQQAMALCLAHDGAMSHRSAASIRTLDGFPRRSDLFELSVPRAQRRPPATSSAVLHVVHELDPIDVVTIDGIPVTSIARTLCDSAASSRTISSNAHSTTPYGRVARCVGSPRPWNDCIGQAPPGPTRS